jgi:sigma-B regulation protein RsbU (phosphoserine phosphatase)
MATLQAALTRPDLHAIQPLRPTECSDDALELDAAGLSLQAQPADLCAHVRQRSTPRSFFALVRRSDTRVLTYTNAGHLSPLLFRNGDVTALDSNGTVVGAFPFAKYTESCITLELGDLLVCYTDGITEPENAYGEMFGEERLIDLVKRHAGQNDHDLVQNVLESVRSWTGTPELHDDMTLLLARTVQPA